MLATIWVSRPTICSATMKLITLWNWPRRSRQIQPIRSITLASLRGRAIRMREQESYGKRQSACGPIFQPLTSCWEKYLAYIDATTQPRNFTNVQYNKIQPNRFTTFALALFTSNKVVSNLRLRSFLMQLSV